MRVSSVTSWLGMAIEKDLVCISVGNMTERAERKRFDRASVLGDHKRGIPLIMCFRGILWQASPCGLHTWGQARETR